MARPSRVSHRVAVELVGPVEVRRQRIARWQRVIEDPRRHQMVLVRVQAVVSLVDNRLISCLVSARVNTATSST
jgi:hypothetical protein